MGSRVASMASHDDLSSAAMSQTSPGSVLGPHLWELRAHFEAQLRRLTDVQHAVDLYRTLMDGKERTRTKAQILDDLRTLATKGETIAALLAIVLRDASNDLGP